MEITSCLSKQPKTAHFSIMPKPRRKPNENGDWLCKGCNEYKPLDKFEIQRNGDARPNCKMCRNTKETAKRLKARGLDYKYPRLPTRQRYGVEIPDNLREALQFKVRAVGIEAALQSISIPRSNLDAILGERTSKVHFETFERICLFTGRHDYMDQLPIILETK